MYVFKVKLKLRLLAYRFRTPIECPSSETITRKISDYFQFYFIEGDALGDGCFSLREIRVLQDVFRGIFGLVGWAGIGDCEISLSYARFDRESGTMDKS